MGQVKNIEAQRTKWRIYFRRRTGAQPLEERRAEQTAKRAEKAAARLLRFDERMARRSASVERKREKQREWRLANPDRNRALIRAWKDRNPEKVRADKRGREIAKRQETIAVLSKLQRGRCAICREKLTMDLHIDHIIPKKLGGSNDRSNLQLTCQPCNLSKGAKHPLAHARHLGMLL